MTQSPPRDAFIKAIARTGCLCLKIGLQAIKEGEGRGNIKATEQDKVLGSVCIDDDRRRAEPNSSRWDYAVGYNRSGQPHVYYIEEHPATTHGIGEISKKFQWLNNFLSRPASGKLSRLSGEFHWLQHRGNQIPHHIPKYKAAMQRLRDAGIQGPVPSVILS